MPQAGSESQDPLFAIPSLIADKRLVEASAIVDALLARDPSNPLGWRYKGLITAKQGNPQAAIACFTNAISVKPDFKDACADLAGVLERLGHTAHAIKAYEHLLLMEQMPPTPHLPVTVNPSQEKEVQAWFEKGQAFQQRGDSANAAMAFQKVLAFRPDMPEAMANLGIARYYQQQLGEAEDVLLHCLHIRPRFAEVLNVLGSIYGLKSQPLKAIAAWRQAIAADPGHLGARVNAVKALMTLKLYDEAIQACENALHLTPDHTDILMAMFHMLHILSRWERIEEIRPRVKEALAAGNRWTQPFWCVVHFPEFQRKLAQCSAKTHFSASRAYDPRRPLPMEKRNNQKLRIGYLSNDFYEHATAFLISEMLEKHDRDRFEVYAYSHGPDAPGQVRERIMHSVDCFRDIKAVNDYEASALIAQDGVDIMIDLKGYTTGERLAILAQRPAPVQIHYLGFPGSLGAPFIDYFVSDAVASPVGADSAFSECLIRLPFCYQVNDRARPLPLNVLPRTAYGLPEDGIVFCDFNNGYKITRDVFDVWMRLLAAVDGSVLWLLESNDEATRNLHIEAQRVGIDHGRIVMAPRAPLAEHLSRYRHVDLCLDTFPCCSHTTASDALWCGAPIVTMAGEFFVSRVAASLLHAVGLPELVTRNLQEYESLVLALAKDRQRLAGLRQHLEEGRWTFPLFDSAATTRALEAAYLHAAERHRKGLAPQAFSISPDFHVA